MNYYKPLSLLLLLSLLGCTRGFKPPPWEFETWKKDGTSPLEVKRALLECGYLSPHNIMSPNNPLSDNEIAERVRCMRNSGFKERYYFCDRIHNPPPSCQPDAVIPTRNVERRLNSEYCQTWGKTTRECQPPGAAPIPQPATELPLGSVDESYVVPFDYPDKPTQLQQQMQFDSEQDMKQLLKNTAPSRRR